MDISASHPALRTVLKSQYHAAPAMLREAIERCPFVIKTSFANGQPHRFDRLPQGAAGGRISDYSCLSASTGLIRVARRAGR
jgi:hypothetical protein